MLNLSSRDEMKLIFLPNCAFIRTGHIIACILLQSFVAAQAQVIESVDVKTVDRNATIAISFSRRLAYRAHAPRTHGDRIVIGLQPLDARAGTGLKTIRQNFPWRPTTEVPLKQVIYNKSPNNQPTLTLRFNRNVRFDVHGTPDGSRLEISVVNPAVAPVRSAQAAVVPKPDHSSGPKASAAMGSAAAVKSAQVVVKPKPDHSSGPKTSAAMGSAAPVKSAQVAVKPKPDHSSRPKTSAGMGSKPASAESDQSTAALMEQARIAMVKHHYTSAIELYTRIVDAPKNEHSQQALEYLGLARELNGEPEQAKIIYQKYLKQYPKTFLVNLKSFTDRREAEKLVQSLKRQKVNTVIGAVIVSGTQWFRVQVTGFESKEAAQVYADTVRGELGFTDAWIAQSAQTLRLQQRVTNLATAESKPHDQLRKAKTSHTKDAQINAEYFGSFSNFYNHFALMTDSGIDVVQSSVQADLFLSGRIQTKDWNVKGYFSGGQLIDTLGRNGPGSPTRITNGYMDLARDSWGFNARLGRQNGYNGGVLGKFDGVNAGYMINKRIKVNAVVGFPVEYTTISRANTDNFFYGVNADFLSIDGPWESRIDFNTFFIQQFVDSTQDRLAIGGEMRYFSDNVNFFSLLDYDIMFNSLNIVTFNGNWRMPTQTNANLLLDYRKAPIVTTSNALLYGASVSDNNIVTYQTIDDLLRFLSADQVRDIAKSNSVDSYTSTLSFSHPINDKIQVGADFTATRLSGIPAVRVNSNQTQNIVVDTEGISATGWEYFASARILGNGLIVSGDLASLDFRYTSLQTSSRYGLLINTRYPVTPEFNIGPRLRVNYRDGYNGSNDWTFAPSLRMNYRLRRWLQFEVEAGSEFITGFIPDGNSSFTDGNYYFLVGYRIDFWDNL